MHVTPSVNARFMCPLNSKATSQLAMLEYGNQPQLYAAFMYTSINLTIYIFVPEQR